MPEEREDTAPLPIDDDDKTVIHRSETRPSASPTLIPDLGPSPQRSAPSLPPEAKARRRQRQALHGRDPHARIDDLEDKLDNDLVSIRMDISELREYSAAQRETVKSAGKSMDAIREDIVHLRTDILGTFSKLFIALIFVVLVSMGVVGGIFGTAVQIKGFGVGVGVGGNNNGQQQP